MYVFNFSVMLACNCSGVSPLACICPTKGSDIFPSGRTGTCLEISCCFQTSIERRSFSPMTYDLLSMLTARFIGSTVLARASGSAFEAVCFVCAKPGMAVKANTAIITTHFTFFARCFMSAILAVLPEFLVFRRHILRDFAAGYASLLQLVKQRAVTDVQRRCRPLSVPVVRLQYLQDDLAFKLAHRLPRYFFQRNRPVYRNIGDQRS